MGLARRLLQSTSDVIGILDTLRSLVSDAESPAQRNSELRVDSSNDRIAEKAGDGKEQSSEAAAFLAQRPGCGSRGPLPTIRLGGLCAVAHTPQDRWGDKLDGLSSFGLGCGEDLLWPQDLLRVGCGNFGSLRSRRRPGRRPSCTSSWERGTGPAAFFAGGSGSYGSGSRGFSFLGAHPGGYQRGRARRAPENRRAYSPLGAGSGRRDLLAFVHNRLNASSLEIRDLPAQDCGAAGGGPAGASASSSSDGGSVSGSDGQGDGSAYVTMCWESSGPGKGDGRSSVGSSEQGGDVQEAVGGPVPGLEALVSSAGVGGPPPSLLANRTTVPVYPPQVQVLDSSGGRPVASAAAVGVRPSPRGELRRLQQLRDDARWAEHQQVILRMGVPAFVPAVDRPQSGAP